MVAVIAIASYIHDIAIDIQPSACGVSFSLHVQIQSRCRTLQDCITLHHAATHCNTLQCTATHCNALQHTAQHCTTLHHTASHCNTLQHTATHCNTLQHTATHCNTLQHAATHCNTLQHTATHCNTRKRGMGMETVALCLLILRRLVSCVQVVHGEIKMDVLLARLKDEMAHFL